VRRRTAIVAAALALASCHHAARPAPAPPAAVVRGAFDAIAVTALASHRSVPVPSDLRAGLDPLLIARTVDHPGPLSDYGLDAPVASVSYQLAPAAPITVNVGGTNFDRTLVYVQRAGDPRIYAVLAGVMRPALALVGIDLGPSSG
jgi:Domain of unknown function (DUF4340)